MSDIFDEFALLRTLAAISFVDFVVKVRGRATRRDFETHDS